MPQKKHGKDDSQMKVNKDQQVLQLKTSLISLKHS